MLVHLSLLPEHSVTHWSFFFTMKGWRFGSEPRCILKRQRTRFKARLDFLLSYNDAEMLSVPLYRLQSTWVSFLRNMLDHETNGKHYGWMTYPIGKSTSAPWSVIWYRPNLASFTLPCWFVKEHFISIASWKHVTAQYQFRYHSDSFIVFNVLNKPNKCYSDTQFVRMTSLFSIKLLY